MLGSENEIAAWKPSLKTAKPLLPEGFRLRRIVSGKSTLLVIEGADARGVLYGSLCAIENDRRGTSLCCAGRDRSAVCAGALDQQWDNLNGTIERGYAGRSIFFDDGHVRADLTRAGDYARLLASVGINGCTINNVNADPQMLLAGE